MKKVLSLISALAIMISPTVCFAAGNSYNLNIEQAINLAIDNNKQSEMDDLNINIKEIVLKEAKVELSFGLTGPNDEVAYKVNVEPIKLETELEMAKRTKDANLKSLKLNVYKACLNELTIKKEMEKEQQKLDLLKQKYEILSVQFNQGKITEAEVVDLEYKIDSKELDLFKVESKLNSAELELKKLLNLKLDEDNLYINDTINFKDIIGFDLDVLIDSVQSNDASIYEKTQNIKIREKSLEQTSHYSVSGEYNYEQALFNLETSKYELSDAMLKVETNIRNKYNELLNQKDSTELATKYYELVNRSYSLVNIKYDNGLVSKQELLNSKEKQLEAEYQKIAAINDYSFKKAEFENLIGQSITK